LTASVMYNRSVDIELQ